MLKKMVNGKEVECSPAEEAEIRAMWAASDDARATSQPQPLTADALAKALVSAGVITQDKIDAAAESDAQPALKG